MHDRNHGTLFQTLLIVVAVLLLGSCSSNPDGFPQIASPPPFDYADGDELRSRMHQLAFELQQLDMSLAAEYDDRPSFQQEVVSSLQNIERIGGYLQSGDLSSRHPFLQDDMARFLRDVTKAKDDASRNSPRYYMAGRVSGGCINCHRQQSR